MSSPGIPSVVSLPPRQQLVARDKWPVIGEQSPDARAIEAAASGSWEIEVRGLVRQPRTWSLEECRRLPEREYSADIHCVTRWSKLGVSFRGTLLATLLDQADLLPEARFVSFVAASDRGHSTSLPVAVCRELEVLVAWEADGKPLAVEHGGPIRVVTPNRYFYKSLKWLRRIELLAEDRLGYWEAEAGYHNGANPWREERYLAPTLDRRDVDSLLATRRFAGRDLRGLSADHRDLRTIDARGALLRDADFRHADLRGAVLDGANLSNAHLERADLREASLIAADLEGANLEGADLRGANLVNASVFGATFVDPMTPGTEARVDDSTRFSHEALDQLLPIQRAFIAERGRVENWLAIAAPASAANDHDRPPMPPVRE